MSKTDRFWSRTTPWPLKAGMVLCIIWAIGCVAAIVLTALGVPAP